MLITTQLPRDWSHSISGGAWVETDAGDPAYLHDRKPQERTYFTWPSGSQTTSTAVTITGTRSVAVVPRVAALLGSTLPIGCKVEIRGKRSGDAGYSYDLGGNSTTQTLVRLPDGGVGCVWVFDAGLDAIVAWQVKVFNDVGGSTAITAEDQHAIGEIVVAPAVVIPHETGPAESWSEPKIARTLGGQADHTGALALRSISVRSSILSHAQARFGGLGEGTDWQAVTRALARDPFALAVLYYGTADEAQASMIFGAVSGLGFSGLAGRYQQSDRITITEVPSE